MPDKRRPKKPEWQATPPLVEHSLREARVAYVAGPPSETENHAVTRLSSKNQITLPVAMVRALGLRAGDQISLRTIGDTIYLSRRPQTAEEWIAKFSGSIHVPGWETQESIDAYVQGERESWTRDGDDF